MELIDFKGLNCYHACIINSVNFFGIDYLPSFSTLWSEIDFDYDATFDMYITKRFLSQLKLIGVEIKKLPCASKEEKEKSFSSIKKGDWFAAGMDSFHMPWAPYYQLLNTYHYFFAQKISEDSFCGFDPTCNQMNIQIDSETVLPHVFDIVAIHTCDKNPIRFSVQEEANEVIKILPNLTERLLSHLQKCVGDNRKGAQELSLYVNAMLTNRYLYAHYLENISVRCEPAEKLFNNDFFNKWTAIKNGLIKASLIPDNKNILEAVRLKLSEILEAEKRAAQIISAH